MIAPAQGCPFLSQEQKFVPRSLSLSTHWLLKTPQGPVDRGKNTVFNQEEQNKVASVSALKMLNDYNNFCLQIPFLNLPILLSTQFTY